MHIRSLIFLGLCAAVGMASPAFAETAPAKTFLFSSKAKAEETKKAEAGPKKKLTAKQKAAAEKALAKAEAKKAKEEAKLAAKEKAAEEAKIAAAAKEKADKLAAIAKTKAEKKEAALKAAEARKLAAKARADAAAEARLAKKQAAEDRKMAKVKAEEERRMARAKAADDAREAELAQLASLDVAQTGNNGELRSEAQDQPKPGFFQALFNDTPKQRMLTETRALDAVLEKKQAKKQFKVKPEFEPQEVSFPGYKSGTIVIDTGARYLYLVESGSSARRYAIAVGRDGLQFKGNVKVGDKQEWPRWIPTLDMQKREPKHYGQYKDGMPGGPENPLGARAIYLYDGKKDTHLRIHGTNQPQSIGTSASNGCFRMINEHVMDLYGRVRMGTEVIVM